jgi:glucuronokinase
MLIRSKAYARAGLIGNPSDGYFGKTISFIVRDYQAIVILWESAEVEIQPTERDLSVFPSVRALVEDVKLHGYYGGIRLLKATIKRFSNYCEQNDILLDGRNFSLRYHSNIPPQVGMAGSSAIITACLRALMGFYGVEIPKPVQANLVLSVEQGELGIPAGLQDRVIQAYEGCVFMDFDRKLMEGRGYGEYEELPVENLPPLYVAYSTQLSEGTEVFHNDIRGRFLRGEPEVVEAMQVWAGLAQEARDLIVAGRGGEIGPLLDANFDLRRKLYQLSEGNIRMVEEARRCGATAKFTGSGGAIVGTYEGEEMFERLRRALGELGMVAFKPQILEDVLP